MSAEKKMNLPWVLFLLLVILAGLYFGGRVLLNGHYLFNGNDVVMWTLPLVVYVFFALASSGLSIVAALPSVFGLKQYEPLGNRMVFLAITTLFGAFIAIALELGSLGNIYYILLSPNTSSPIWWMGVFYTLELVFLVFKFLQYQKDDENYSTSLWLGRLSMLAGISAALTLGAVFGQAESRVASYGAFMPVMFLLGAFLSGVALVILYERVRAIFNGTGAAATSDAVIALFPILKVSLGFMLIISVVERIFYSTASIPGMNLTGSYSVISLLIIAWVIAFMPASDKSAGGIASAAIALVAMFLMHMNHILAPQQTPLGPMGEGISSPILYVPNFSEWMIFALSAAVVLFSYAVGESLFRLDKK